MIVSLFLRRPSSRFKQVLSHLARVRAEGEDTRPRSRRALRASFILNFPSSECRGRRECRALGAPAASRATKKRTSIVTTVTPGSPGHSPRNGFNGYFVLSPVTGLFCHCHRRNFFRQLGASVGASGPHDFTVRSSTLSSSA